MKKLIVVLSVVLALLMILAGLLWTGVLGGAERTEETQPPATEPPVTEPPTTEPPSTEPPTEPEPEVVENDAVYIVDGVTLKTWFIEEMLTVRADEFLAAAGLDAEGTAHASDKARVSRSDGALTLDGVTYDTVVGGTLYLPLEELIAAFDYPVWYDEEYGTTYISPSARSFEIAESVNVPVLMYHAVSDNCWGIEELFVSPSRMEEQLAYLVDNGYEPIWFEDLAHVEDYEKPVILTFDDGYDDNYTELYPLLQKYQVKATVFVIASAVGGSHKATEEQVREMSDSGLVSIQSHTYNHGYLDEMGYETQDYELGESQRYLTRLTGKIPKVLCYPTGRFNDVTVELAQKYYDFGIKMVGGLYNTSDGRYYVNRYYVSRYTDIYTFAAYVSAAGT